MDTRGNKVLQGLRLEKGYAVFGLAAAAGVSPSAISAAERWGFIPGEKVRGRIAAALGVTAEEIWPESIPHGGERRDD